MGDSLVLKLNLVSQTTEGTNHCSSTKVHKTLPICKSMLFNFFSPFGKFLIKSHLLKIFLNQFKKTMAIGLQ